jgi:hypothetical protein
MYDEGVTRVMTGRRVGVKDEEVIALYCTPPDYLLLRKERGKVATAPAMAPISTTSVIFKDFVNEGKDETLCDLILS